MEILHTINLTGANCSFVNVDLYDLKTRNSLVLKTPTATLPFLETNNGNISQSTAIEYYLCSKYKPELLGTNEFEKAKVSQWIEFGGCEINRCIKSIIYPIFGWAPYCKEKADEDNTNIKKYLKIIENNLTKSNYIVGEKITLADIILFRYIRLFMMLHFPEGMRNSLFAQTTKWFEKIMKTNDAIKAYGRTVLCKIPIKAFTGEVKRIPLAQLKQEKKEKKEESKEEKKEIEEKESKEEKEEKEKSKNSHKKNETEEEKKARRKAEKEAKKKEKEKAKNKEKNWNAPKEKKEEKTKKVEYYESNAKLVRPNKGQPVLEDDSKKNILITSALPYVNNVPHLGNIIGCVLSADVFARFMRLMGYNTLYVCGTDEYGTATETKALQEKCTPQQLCDKYHALHKAIYDWFDIDFDTFGRTSTQFHTDITQEIFLDLQKNNCIKKEEIEQYRCNKCNITLSDRYIYGTCYHGDCKYEKARGDQCDQCGKLCNALELINPRCKLCNNPPEKFKSYHYFLNLPNVETELRQWIDKASVEGKWTQNSRAITTGFISEGLKERCITRDLKWGVPVPGDDPDMKNKVFYVWFDAPIGYLSITANLVGKENWKKWWHNPDHVKLFQFMGKDNVPFHTVIFPSTLIGTKINWTLLHHLSTTEYLNYEKTKFSKSNGIGVFGDHAESTGIPSEVWRYYLLSNRPETSDTDFKWDDFIAKNNNELLANLGNLVNRILVFTEKNFSGKVPKFHEEKLDDIDKEFFNNTITKFKEYVKAMSWAEIREGVKLFMEISSLGNGYLQTTQPWTLLKKNDPKYDLVKAETIFYILNAFLRFIGALAEPFMPSFSAKLYEIMNVKYEGDSLKMIGIINDFIEKNPSDAILFLVKTKLIEEGQTINKPKPLFKEISQEENNAFKERFKGKQ
jgi:methionyl-tRNA synthetase